MATYRIYDIYYISIYPYVKCMHQCEHRCRTWSCWDSRQVLSVFRWDGIGQTRSSHQGHQQTWVQIQSCLGEGQISRTPKTCISNSQMHATIKWHEISKVGQGSQHNVSHGNAMIFSWLLSSALDSSNGLDTVSAAVTHWRFWWKPNATTFFSAAPEKFEALSLNDENHMQQGHVFFQKCRINSRLFFSMHFGFLGIPCSTGFQCYLLCLAWSLLRLELWLCHLHVSATFLRGPGPCIASFSLVFATFCIFHVLFWN